jgi:polyhydroxyalkanoate synthesis repressor PhaR
VGGRTTAAWEEPNEKIAEVLIRKYSDRRLYNTATSRYVKLKDIARMVRDGLEVRAVDARTGKDLTHIILTQIIMEDAKERQIALPLQLLTQVVRASDKATHDFLTSYLNNALESLTGDVASLFSGKPTQGLGLPESGTQSKFYSILCP